MAACILVFSPRCRFSMQLFQFIEANPQVAYMTQFHNVDVHGIPQQYSGYITRVPTLLTRNGKFLVGGEIKNWFESVLPSGLDSFNVGSTQLATLDGMDDDNYFDLRKYGQSLEAPMTPELAAKINSKVV